MSLEETIRVRLPSDAAFWKRVSARMKSADSI